MKKVVIIHIGRVGSTVLVRQMAQTPHIFSAGEIYNDGVNQFSHFVGKEWWQIYDNYLDFLDFMHQKAMSNLRAQDKSDSGHYLFEYKPYLKGCEYNMTALFREMSNRGVEKFVFLNRENYIRRLVSALKSFQTNVWHIKEESESAQGVNNRQNLSTIHLNPLDISDGDMDAYHIALENAIDKYYESFIPSVRKQLVKYSGLEISYEKDIEQDPRFAYKKMCDFLGIIPSKAKVDLARQNPFPLSQMISNFTEIDSYLKNTKYHHLLYQ